MRQKCIALEYHRRITLVGCQAVDGLPAQIDLTLIRALKSGNHAKGGRLSAAGRAKKRHKCSRFDIQCGVMHRIEVFSSLGILIYFGNMF